MQAKARQSYWVVVDGMAGVWGTSPKDGRTGGFFFSLQRHGYPHANTFRHLSSSSACPGKEKQEVVDEESAPKLTSHEWSEPTCLRAQDNRWTVWLQIGLTVYLPHLSQFFAPSV